MSNITWDTDWNTFKKYKEDNPNAKRRDYRKAAEKANVQVGFFKDDTTNAFSTIGSIAGSMSNMNGSISPAAGAVREGIRDTIGKFGPWGAVISAATGVVDTIMDQTGMALNTVDQSAANRAGAKTGAIVNNLWASLPGNSIFGLVTGKTNTAQKSSYIDAMTPSYSSSTADINAATQLGGKRVLFGKNKMNQFIDEANQANNLITNIAMQSELVKNSNSAELYQQQNFNKYSGYTPQLLLAKKGSKIPELEIARTIIAEFSKTEIESFKSGGKLDMNIIPEGALHKNKHHLEEVNPELEGTITEKGIPVITEDGEQKAEIEKEEIVFKKSTTEQLEEYYDQYNNSKDDSIAIECGKFLVEEILKRTEDRTGLLKTVSDE